MSCFALIYLFVLRSFSFLYYKLIAAVIQQVKHFRDTEYGSDGVTSFEQAFEQALRVKKGAFVLVETSDTKNTTGGGGDQSCFFFFFLQMLQHIGGGPTLLPKKEKEPKKKDRKEASSLSFQSDRRLVRLVIFRYFLDRAISRFRNQQQLVDGNNAHDWCNQRAKQSNERTARTPTHGAE